MVDVLVVAVEVLAVVEIVVEVVVGLPRVLVGLDGASEVLSTHCEYNSSTTTQLKPDGHLPVPL